MKLIKAAENYLLAGLNPLPLHHNKAPKLAPNHPYLYEEIPENLIDRLFKSAEKIGVACGLVSDNFYCIDFDRHNLENNLDTSFNAYCEDVFIADCIASKRIGIYTTPSKGYHLYFKAEQAHKGQTFAYYKDGDVMIELRGNGQYACTAPSEGYKKIKGASILEIDRLDDSEVGYLFDLARSFSLGKRKSTKQANDTDSERKWPEKWDVSTPKGKFNEENITTVEDWLTEANWRYMHTRESDKVQYWQRPNKPEDDRSISATFGAQRGMFYCFSDSNDSAPFEGGGAYSPFDVFCLLKHNGDWKSALKEITPKPEPIELPKQEKVADILAFPVDVFPTMIQEFIHQLKEGADFYEDFSAIGIMYAFALCNGNRIKLKVKNSWHAPSIFWFMALGTPGTKKTHPIKTIIDPFTKWDVQSHKKYRIEKEEYDNLDDKNKAKNKAPKFKQTIISDATIESIHLIHSINPKGIGLYKDEIKGFIGDMNKYRQGGKGSDTEFWLESFNNGTFYVNRVSREPVLITDVNIQIIGTIQPDKLEEIVSQVGDNGLIDRFLFTRAESWVYSMSHKDIEPETLTWWNDLISQILNHADLQYNSKEDETVLEMDAECMSIYYAFDEELTEIQNNPDVNNQIKGYVSKIKTYFPRFILLIALMDMYVDGLSPEVLPETLKKAKKLCRYFMSTAENIFSETDGNREIKRIIETAKGKTKGEQIIYLFEKGFKNAEISKALKVSRAYVSRVVNQKS
jgi:hypothetical protein